jgi:ubiquinol-cytochrome c reductase cytochrome b subunit
MSFWGATVIINLLSPIPSLIEILYGGYYLYNLTLKRFFILHFQFPFLIIIFIFIHILYSSGNNEINIRLYNLYRI